MPRAESLAARSIAVIVLPAPPTVALPQQMTGTAAWKPGLATRCAVILAVSAAMGESRRGASFAARRKPRNRAAGSFEQVLDQRGEMARAGRLRWRLRSAQPPPQAWQRSGSASMPPTQADSAASSCTIARPPAADRLATASSKFAVFGPTATAQPRRAGSQGFWPPPGVKLLPRKNDAGEPVEQPHFAQRIANPKIARVLTLRASWRAAKQAGNRLAAFGVAGDEDGEQVGKPGAQRRVNAGGQRLLTRVGACREPDRAASQPGFSAGSVPPRPRGAGRRQVSGRPVL